MTQQRYAEFRVILSFTLCTSRSASPLGTQEIVTRSPERTTRWTGAEQAPMLSYIYYYSQKNDWLKCTSTIFLQPMRFSGKISTLGAATWYELANVYKISMWKLLGQNGEQKSKPKFREILWLKNSCQGTGVLVKSELMRVSTFCTYSNTSCFSAGFYYTSHFPPGHRLNL